MISELVRGPAPEAPDPVSSPCIGVCTLDSQDICIGCSRSAEEITRWTAMTDSERESIMDRLEGLGTHVGG
ncbi:MAG: DUF1289 domain-containing protein [Lysobacterales bacterium]